jgi:hypothetical protein
MEEFFNLERQGTYTFGEISANFLPGVSETAVLLCSQRTILFGFTRLKK